MTEVENKTVFRGFYEDAWNAGDLQLLDTLLAPGFVNHELADQGSISHHELYKQATDETRAAFPDWRNVVEELIAEGDLVAARWHAEGMRTGAGMEDIPLGKVVRISGIAMVRVVDGKITDFWKKDRHLA
jgi:predicted ester cyclase